MPNGWPASVASASGGKPPSAGTGSPSGGRPGTLGRRCGGHDRYGSRPSPPAPSRRPEPARSGATLAAGNRGQSTQGARMAAGGQGPAGGYGPGGYGQGPGG